MLKEFDQDTIAAISTPPGEGGIGVIRLSGPEAIAIAGKIFQSSKKIPLEKQPSFTVQHGYIIAKNDSGKTEKIDEVLVLLMRSPKSYTREDVVEISAHGGAVILEAILNLSIRQGARLAAKGEFTKRAFLNGRIDLLQSEAVLDLVRAKTALGRRWAGAQLEGALSCAIKSIKTELVNSLTHLEASIDFPEDSLETESVRTMETQLASIAQRLSKLLLSARLGFIAKNGLKVVIAGRPNVGKSSLMNCLARTDRVIVTPYAGTTRDTVETQIQIQGFPVSIVDTAGIQETSHPIEIEGIKRTKAAVFESDVVLYVMDASQEGHPDDDALLRDLGDKPKIIVLNKCDLPQNVNERRIRLQNKNAAIFNTSCITHEGIEWLENEIVGFITHGKAQSSEEVVVSSVRQKHLLEKAFQNVTDATNGARSQLSPELLAVDVRLALDQLGALVGEVVTDDILEALFSQFCVGK